MLMASPGLPIPPEVLSVASTIADTIRGCKLYHTFHVCVNTCKPSDNVKVDSVVVVAILLRLVCHFCILRFSRREIIVNGIRSRITYNGPG